MMTKAQLRELRLHVYIFFIEFILAGVVTPVIIYIAASLIFDAPPLPIDPLPAPEDASSNSPEAEECSEGDLILLGILTTAVVVIFFC